MPCLSKSENTLKDEILHEHTVTQICYKPAKAPENVKQWMRILLCVANLSTSLYVASFLVTSRAKDTAFCACIEGEQLTTDVTATCTVQGSSEFSCPGDCLFRGDRNVTANNWRAEWNTDNFCDDHPDVAGAQTCEPTVACCMAFMIHLEKQNDDHDSGTYTYWYYPAPHTQPASRAPPYNRPHIPHTRSDESTVEGVKNYECSGWIYEVYINIFVSFFMNMIINKLVKLCFFQGNTVCPCLRHVGVAWCFMLLILTITAPSIAAAGATHYGFRVCH